MEKFFHYLSYQNLLKRPPYLLLTKKCLSDQFVFYKLKSDDNPASPEMPMMEILMATAYSGYAVRSCSPNPLRSEMERTKPRRHMKEL